MYNPKIEVKDTSYKQIYHRGEDVGKPTGDKSWEIFFDGEKRGSIYNPGSNRFWASSNNYKIGLGSKLYKTFNGALNFITKYESKYVPIGLAFNGE